VVECSVCGSQENLKRERVRRLIAELEHEMPGIRDSMRSAMTRVVPSHLLDRRLFDFHSPCRSPRGDG
jgi:tRNA 2-thiocytidine biosynthesis protein TtcA